MMAMFVKPAVAASSHASASLAQETIPGGPPQKKSRSESVDKDAPGEAPKKSCSDGAVGNLVHKPATTEDEGITQKAPEDSKLDLHEGRDKDGTPGEQPEVALIEEAEDRSEKHVPGDDAVDNSAKKAQVASDGSPGEQPEVALIETAEDGSEKHVSCDDAAVNSVQDALAVIFNTGGCTEAAVPECEVVTEAQQNDGMRTAVDNNGENAPAESTDATAVAPSTSGNPLAQKVCPWTGGETATPSESVNPLEQEACLLT